MKAGVWARTKAETTARTIAQTIARTMTLALVALLGVSACSHGPVRRVSEPSALVQQLTVRADGRWAVDLRIENYSSIPMQFDSVDLLLSIGDSEAGHVTAQPAVSIGPESADVVTAVFTPQAAAKLAVADALAGGRSVGYTLAGTIAATPDEKRQRSFQVKRSSQLNPAPGLPGVLR